jgi:hypothetical protein
MPKLLIELSPVKVYVRNDYIYRQNLAPLINKINSLDVKSNTTTPGWINTPILSLSSINNYAQLVRSRKPIVINNMYKGRLFWGTILSFSSFAVCGDPISFALIFTAPLYYTIMTNIYNTQTKEFAEFEEDLKILNKCFKPDLFEHEYETTLLD